jgi:hypothetical protein
MIDLDLDIDLLLDQALCEGELVAGVAPGVVAARFPGLFVSPEITIAPAASASPRWSRAEEQFVRDHIGYYSEAEIAAILGRTPVALKVRRQKTRISWPALSRRPDILTATAVARALGVDVHNVLLLHRRGLLPNSWRVSKKGFCLIRKITLYYWAVNPMHWPYFIRSVHQPDRFGDPHLRRLIIRQRDRWADDWWTPGQVAAHCGVRHQDVNRYIRAGKITGCIKWGNWWIPRSQATRPDLIFYQGYGSAQRVHWTPAADAFLFNAHSRGYTWAAIARLMKRSQFSVQNRYYHLKEQSNAQAD